METIFDHNVSKKELDRFGGMSAFKKAKDIFGSYYKNEDDANYHLGILFAMRGEKAKSN